MSRLTLRFEVVLRIVEGSILHINSTNIFLSRDDSPGLLWVLEKIFVGKMSP